jgi:hypothetical protein
MLYTGFGMARRRGDPTEVGSDVVLVWVAQYLGLAADDLVSGHIVALEQPTQACYRARPPSHVPPRCSFRAAQLIRSGLANGADVLTQNTDFGLIGGISVTARSCAFENSDRFHVEHPLATRIFQTHLHTKRIGFAQREDCRQSI